MGGVLYPGAKALMAAFPIGYFTALTFVYTWDTWAQKQVNALKVRTEAQVRTFGEYKEHSDSHHHDSHGHGH